MAGASEATYPVKLRVLSCNGELDFRLQFFFFLSRPNCNKGKCRGYEIRRFCTGPSQYTRVKVTSVLQCVMPC